MENRIVLKRTDEKPSVPLRADLCPQVVQWRVSRDLTKDKYSVQNHAGGLVNWRATVETGGAKCRK
jgi:hypothetical protein